MPSRSGGFGGSLNPFGTGSLGSFSQYDIASDVADLAAYEVEVAWGNGKATDEAYIAALTRVRDATSPATQKRAAAQNKLDDAVYRIGRSKVEGDLDALIAFDQRSLGGMDPSNLRYRDIKQSLDSEHAQRRSRDYGSLVDDYNAGRMSSEALLGWVSRTLSGLSADDPDYNSWVGVRTDLQERIVSEKDAKVYQDYQQRRMPPAEFLAYVKSRRDAYSPSSPKWAEWDRKLEDATVNVRDTALARKDQAFFARYEEGKVSDATYLKYLRTRIAGMKPGDPALGEWRHRLHQAAFSLAEDKLRYDVQRGRAKVGTLIDFYRDYRHTLNPGSAEYRQISLQIMSLKKSLPGTGHGRGSGKAPAGVGAAQHSTGVATASKQQLALDKIIDPHNTISGLAGDRFVIDPTANKKSIAAAAGFLRLNIASAGNAVRQGDSVWLFHDPRHPNAVVAGRNPDGSPMLDSKGRPIMVRGSSYLPASNEVYSNLKSIEGSNWMGAAELALHNKDITHYTQYLKSAEEALDQARTADSTSRSQNWQDWYDATDKGIEALMHQGRYVEAVTMATDLARRLAGETRNPYLDDTRRSELEGMLTKLEKNPLLPHVDPATGTMTPGALNLTALGQGQAVLNVGWHNVLKSSSTGQADYGPVFDDRQDGSWEAAHVTIHTTYGGQVVTGEVPRSSAPVGVVINTDHGQATVQLPGDAQFFAFQDENGHTVRGYSIDGLTWISPGAGQPPPVVEFGVRLQEVKQADGSVQYVDPASGEVAFAKDAGGAWSAGDYVGDHPDAVGWYGQRAWEESKVGLAPYGTARDEMRSLLLQQQAGISIGAPGQRMTLTTVSENGTINLAGTSWFPKGVTAAGRLDERLGRPPASARSKEAILMSAAAHDRDGTTAATATTRAGALEASLNRPVADPTGLAAAFSLRSPDRGDAIAQLDPMDRGDLTVGSAVGSPVVLPTLGAVSTVLPALIKARATPPPIKKPAPPTKAPNKAMVKKATTAGITFTGIPTPPRPKTKAPPPSPDRTPAPKPSTAKNPKLL